jgi:GTP cyclohydrolase I
LARSYVAKALCALGLSEKDLPDDELDLVHTPRRVVRMWLELTRGVRSTPPHISAFKSSHEQLLMLRDIPFVSLCSHHMIPFRGRAHIGYIPKGRVVGISKPARVVDYFASMPQTQERLTELVASHLMSSLKPMGVMVVLVAEHVCISCRGARKPGSSFVTSAVKGVFLKDPSAKSEFLDLLKLRVE